MARISPGRRGSDAARDLETVHVTLDKDGPKVPHPGRPRRRRMSMVDLIAVGLEALGEVEGKKSRVNLRDKELLLTLLDAPPARPRSRKQ